MDLKSVTQISASGLKAQSLRMRVIAENLANADSVAVTPGGDPYRRKLAVFRPHSTSAGEGVKVQGIARDRSDFERVYEPGNPAADAQGYVRHANVNSLIETADMKSAQRSYEANLNAIEAARGMTLRTIDLLK
ncbi:flagellar basal body rod protein FlgC [Sphingomonas arenae]|uniref:flagellar basal body rod protein FlgC n=1 Tax=Sphingomonas arenae TaxID=2812555 RepID=UPI0019672C95|nr:flagellar basal body rod protein FlgC [Sphingomonas arenae]